MKTYKFRIPGMKSTHCQLTVRNAIETKGGIISNIEPTLVAVEIESENGESMRKAIESAGYSVSEIL